MKFQLYRTTLAAYETETVADYRLPTQWESRVTVAEEEIRRSEALLKARPKLAPKYTVTRWYLELHNLEELQDFIKDVKSMVIVGQEWLEIYDGYRE